MAIRIDAAGYVQAFKKLPNGWIHTEGYPAKVGILTYKKPDGSVIREFRPEEELFSAETMDSFKLLPVTLNHPPVLALTADNTNQFQVGHLGDSCHKRGDKVAVSIALTQAGAIQEAQQRSHELSLGYSCDVEETPGVWQGQPYDRIQRKVRGNHVALVEKGRAGADCHIRLDAADNAVVEEPTNTPPAVVKSEASVSEPYPKQAPQVRLDALFGMLDAERLAHQATQKEMQEVKQELAELKKQRADSVSEEKIASEIKLRMGLIEKARVLSPEIKLDSWDAKSIQIQAISAVDTEFAKTLEDKTPEYISGVFETLSARRADSNIVRVTVQGDNFFTRSDAAKQGTETPNYQQEFLASAEASWQKGLK